MKLNAKSFVEHRTAGALDILPPSESQALLLTPGSCTTCLASTTCSCCCSGAVSFGSWRQLEE